MERHTTTHNKCDSGQSTQQTDNTDPRETTGESGTPGARSSVAREQVSTQNSSVQTEGTELQQLKGREDDKRYTVNKITGQSARPGEGRLVGDDSKEKRNNGDQAISQKELGREDDHC